GSPQRPSYSCTSSTTAQPDHPTPRPVTRKGSLAYLPADADEEKNRRVVQFMREFPAGEDAEIAKNALKDASLLEAHYLALLAKDEIQSRRRGSIFAPGLGVMGLEKARELHAKGLVRQVRLPHQPEKAVYVLTDKGRNVARVFTAAGNPPTDYPKELVDIAKNVDEYQAMLKARTNAINPDIPVDDV
ncbi:winged helix-turn-helix transcriptional regulator, partial [Micromonospora sp. NPDC051925]|uniref:winged helix-turn-helix transcriptional regulator n=1 Tax=Micromonospora sp. NPDC051925 TaxID=3364288 RepID=UPI0037C6657B